MSLSKYNENSKALYEQKLVNPNEIFELKGNPEDEEYLELFEFYQSNLHHLEEKFGCEPSYFYIRNEAEINAKARKRSNNYTIGINHKVLHTLFTKYQAYFNVTEIKGLEEYQGLQNILTNDLHDLIYQAVLHFNFYHEWAHLLQFKAEGDSEVSLQEDSNIYDEESHIAEIDADCVSCYSCASHFYQYLKKYSSQKPTQELSEKFLSIVTAATIIYICEFLNEFDVFYLKDKKYPHPSIRACNITTEITGYYLNLQIELGVTESEWIRISEIGGEIRRVCKILSTHFQMENKYLRIEELVRENIVDIGAYLHEVKNKISGSEDSAVNERKRCI